MNKLLKIAVTISLFALFVMDDVMAGEVLDRVIKKQVLVVATDPNYPPQSFQKPDGSFEGFDIDVAHEIAKRLGVDIKFVTPAWEIITAGRWGGRWDLSVGSMTPTKERKEVLDFPAIYYFAQAIFYVHKDSKANSLLELNGKTIGTCGSCTYENYLKKNLVIDAEGAPPFRFQVTPGRIRTYETDINAMDDLRLGDGIRLDAGITALPTITEAIKNGYPLRLVGEPVFYEPLALAVAKGDTEFNAKLKEIIETMRTDGTLKRLSNKWYSVDLSTTTKSTTEGTDNQETRAQIYKVLTGDSLSKIAFKFYQDVTKWDIIFKANKQEVPNPNMIKVGQKLTIPPLSGKSTTTTIRGSNKECIPQLIEFLNELRKENLIEEKQYRKKHRELWEKR